MKGIWKYRELLPSLKYQLTLGEGGTPLYEDSNGIFIKDERINPTGSFEDRFSAFFVSYLKSTGKNKIVCNWDYDRIVSLASYCSKAGIEFVTSETNLPLLLLGAKTAKEEEDTLLRNLNMHVGEKTTTYEILEEIEPESVVLPVGSGSHLVMSVRASIEMVNMGLAKKSPMFFGVMPESSTGKDSSIASYLVGHNHFLKEVMQLQEKGMVKLVYVNEKEILEAQENLAKEGILASASASASYAGARKVKGNSIVCIVAGRFKSHTHSLTETKLMILRNLYRNPSHGYVLWKWMSHIKEISFQAIYQHLKELESMGLVIATKKDDRVVYSITEYGKSALLEGSI